MLRKKEVFTTITPIPSQIPRQLAIDILHSHSELITINPLVTDHKPISAPRNAAADEYYATWYEITEKVKLLPGIGRLGTATISFNACFHDMPWGLQTHVYAPAGVDMRNNWRVCGNQPGEPAEPRGLGVDTPAEGLYLREDIEIKANMTMVGFVKAEMKRTSKIMVERMVKKAELLDQGLLLAMMQNGKLKTVNPNDRTAASLLGMTDTYQSSPEQRPQSMYSNISSDAGTLSPRQSFRLPQKSPGLYRPMSNLTDNGSPVEVPGNYLYTHPESQAHELPHHTAPQQQYQPPQTIMELPGDFQYAVPPSRNVSARSAYSASDYNGSQTQNSPTTGPGEHPRWSEQSGGGASRGVSYYSASDIGNDRSSHAPAAPQQQLQQQQQQHPFPTTSSEYPPQIQRRTSQTPPQLPTKDPRRSSSLSAASAEAATEAERERLRALKQLEAYNGSGAANTSNDLSQHPAYSPTKATSDIKPVYTIGGLPSQQQGGARKYDGEGGAADPVPLPLMPRVPGGRTRMVLP